MTYNKFDFSYNRIMLKVDDVINGDKIENHLRTRKHWELTKWVGHTKVEKERNG